MPSPATMSASISRKQEAERRSSSCTNSPPTTPIGSRRCAISRAATAASPIPPAATRRPTCRASKEVYTYKHFYTDALAVLDHLEIAKAHFVGLSMGSYSSLQVGLNSPERALSLTLAAVGAGSSLENLEAFRKQCQANGEQYETIGSDEVAKVTREAPSRIPFLVKDPRGHADFYAALARHDARGSANTMRSFQGGRPSIYTLTDAIRKVPTPTLIICGDEDDNCIEPSLFLKKHLPAAGLDVLSEDRPRAQSGGAGAVQRDGRAVHRAGGGRPMAGARSKVGGGGDRIRRHSGAMRSIDTDPESFDCTSGFASATRPGMTVTPTSPSPPGSAGTRPARRTCSRTTTAD